MRYKQLGSTGFQASVVGIGGLPLQRVSSASVKEIILSASACGVNFVDTARNYADSEAKLGLALVRRRRSFFIASKSAQRTRQGILKAVMQSLNALRTEHIDLYQLHNVATQSALSEVLGQHGALEGLHSAQQAGYIRYIGVSGHNDVVLQDAINTRAFSTVQAPYNPLEMEFLPVFARAKTLGMGTIAMKPLAGGAFRQTALALRAVLSQELIDVVIPGIGSARELEHNASLAGCATLSSNEQCLLLQEVMTLGRGFCRRCGYCIPCPQGIAIPSIFLLDGYHSRYNLERWAHQRYCNLRPQASACVQCGLCEQRCPYGLEVRAMLARAHNTLSKRPR